MTVQRKEWCVACGRKNTKDLRQQQQIGKRYSDKTRESEKEGCEKEGREQIENQGVGERQWDM